MKHSTYTLSQICMHTCTAVYSETNSLSKNHSTHTHTHTQICMHTCTAVYSETNSKNHSTHTHTHRYVCTHVQQSTMKQIHHSENTLHVHTHNRFTTHETLYTHTHKEPICPSVMPICLSLPPTPPPSLQFQSLKKAWTNVCV